MVLEKGLLVLNNGVTIVLADVVHAVFPGRVSLLVRVKNIEWIEGFFNLFKDLIHIVAEDRR